MFVVGIGLTNKMFLGVSSCKGYLSTQTELRFLSSSKATNFPSKTSPLISRMAKTLATRSWSYVQKEIKEGLFKS